MSNKFGIFAFSVLMYIFSVPFALSANENSGIREISDSVYTFTLGEGNHSMFVIGEDGVAVFETFHSGHSQKLLEAVQNLTDKPIKYAFISHNHWDHASGGQVFSNVGAQTVMHKRAAVWLEANPGRDTALPDITWSGDSEDFDMGDFTVNMHYLGLNHGMGLTVFTIPERRAVYIADLVTPNRVMFSVVPDFNIGEW